MKCAIYLLFFLLTLAVVSCEQKPPTAPSVAAATNAQVFQVKGVIASLGADGRTAEIKHEAIPGYMGAMTMEFETRDTNELRGLAPGDSVSFRLWVTDKDGWIDRVTRLETPKTEPVTTMPKGLQLVRDVDPLAVGDALPDYQFTNQFGRPFRTTDFKGQALAITFIFTRCPFPTFCPRMTGGFAETQAKLLADPQSPTNWHLLTISFDPEFDAPATLKAYAERNGCDPARWTFATGEPMDINSLCEQFGLEVWRDTPGGLPNHNLRTVVVDASGRVRTILIGNKWTADELAAELRKAAAVKP
jgi:protein SCO1/2